MKFYCASPEEVLTELRTAVDGLDDREAASRLSAHGPNKLAEPKKDSLLKRFLHQLADPMILILLAAAVVSAFTSAYSGEGLADVVIILAVVIINAVLGVYQESKAEQAIEALKKMTESTSRVVRGGTVSVIHSSELVPGDVILLEAGDAVPADARVLESASLKAEEAALTGESVPVTKQVAALERGSGEDVPLGDRSNMVYMGGTVVYGRGSAVVTATGMETEMGKIADALQNAREGQTPLQRKLSQLSKVLTVLVLSICAVIFAVGMLRAGGLTGEAILSSFMIAVSLAVAAIPEGLAAVVTVVLSIGVTNMSRRNAVIRRLTAVETLGCAQVICSDKTGTLTQNKMTVVEHRGEAAPLARAMTLCCDAESDGEGGATGEPTECALVVWAFIQGADKAALRKTWPRLAEVPFDSLRKMMSTVCRVPAEAGLPHPYLQFTKGAPDEVLRRCTTVLRDGAEVPMTDALRAEILSENKGMADRALRVLAAASRPWDKLPAAETPEELEHDLCFLGLCGMIDPVRPEVKAAIEECRSAGIRPVMITGDHVDTARAIAAELGILEGGRVAITGAQLSAMSDEEFARRLPDIAVYARVQPEHKVRIVNAWKAAGCVTAMTGDGVNDAPSIKSADIGVGMGITGTDVTKNVADMVLADDNFATIVGAVEEGRRIYDNIRKAIQFLLSSNMSEVLSIFFATLLGFTILKPVHLLWINLITDCFPALALGTESAEPGLMERAPRSGTEGVFARGMGFDVAWQGVAITLLTLAAYFIGHFMEAGVWEIANSADGMTMAFLTMSLAEVCHSINLRSQRGSIFRLHTHNRLLAFAAVFSLVSTAAVIWIPFLRDAFGFEHISLGEFFTALALAFCIIPLTELVKLIQRAVARRKGARA